MQRTGRKKTVPPKPVRDRVPRGAASTAVKPLDFLFIGGGKDSAARMKVWRRTSDGCNQVSQRLMIEKEPGKKDEEKLASLFEHVRQMRKEGAIPDGTQIIADFHGDQKDGVFYIGTAGGKFRVKLEDFISGLRQALAGDGQVESRHVLYLPSCSIGKFRDKLAVGKGPNFLLVGNKEGLDQDGEDTIQRAIIATGSEPRNGKALSSVQVQRLWQEMQATTGENIAWVDETGIRLHKALEYLLDPGNSTTVDARKRTRVIFAKLVHGSLDSLQQALGNAPLEAIKDRYIEGLPPLALAAIFERHSGPKIDYLVETLGQDIAEVDENQLSALHLVAEEGRADALLSLIHQGADVLQREADFCLPLHLAAESSKDAWKKIELLVNADPERKVDRPGPKGWSALQMAVSKGNRDAVMALLFCGADPEFKNQEGNTALDLARRLPEGENKADILALLRAMQSSVNLVDEDGHTQLHIEAALGTLQDVQDLLDQGANPWRRDSAGALPLHRVAHSSTTDTREKLEALLALGPDINATDLNGNSAVHVAASAGNEEALAVLLALGADPGNPNHLGVLPIHCAQKNVVDLLLQAMQSQASNKPRSPGPSLRLNRLMETSQSRRHLSPLLKLPGALERRDSTGVTPLAAAAMLNGNPKVVRYLLEKGATPDVRFESGQTLLDYLQAQGKKDMVELLLEYGADPNW